MFDYLSLFSQTISSIHSVIFLAIILLHFIFASGVAKDIGNLNKRNIPTLIIPGYAWVLTTLLMGLFGLLAYWLIHHSTLSK
jgi:SNF family Na+-dependent transporter